MGPMGLLELNFLNSFVVSTPSASVLAGASAKLTRIFVVILAVWSMSVVQDIASFLVLFEVELIKMTIIGGLRIGTLDVIFLGTRLDSREVSFSILRCIVPILDAVPILLRLLHRSMLALRGNRHEVWLRVFAWFGCACGDRHVATFNIAVSCLAYCDDLLDDHEWNPGKCEAHDSDDRDTIGHGAAITVSYFEETHSDRFERDAQVITCGV